LRGFKESDEKECDGEMLWRGLFKKKETFGKVKRREKKFEGFRESSYIKGYVFGNTQGLIKLITIL
jgi:hypothetical protein